MSGQQAPRAATSPGEARFDRLRKGIGRIAAPLVFVALLAFPPGGLTPDGETMAAIAVATIILWITEAIPLAATALLAPAVAVILGVAPAQEAFSPFAHPLIFLFMGGFILARALTVWGFDRRATLWLLSRPVVAGSPARATVMIGVIAFSFSMWISNTATTAMLVPIALGLCTTMAEMCPSDSDTQRKHGKFSQGMLLTLAYGASIGGVATPIGTAPNMIALAELESYSGTRLDFLQWVSFAFPTALLALIGLLVIGRMMFPPAVKRLEGMQDFVRGQLERLGAVKPAERRSLAVFAVAVTGWLTPAVFRLALGEDAQATVWARESLPEGIVAVVAAMLLFWVPSGERDEQGEQRMLLTWREAVQIDWGSLFLLGGGFALSKLVFKTGLAETLAASILDSGGANGVLLLVLATALVIYMTELVSNMATTTMLLPVLIPIAAGAGIDPIPVALCVTMAASFAFMLPVSTPPNAIAYGSGAVKIGSMIRFGAWLDVFGLILLVAIGLLFLPLLGL